MNLSNERDKNDLEPKNGYVGFLTKFTFAYTLLGKCLTVR